MTVESAEFKNENGLDEPGHDVVGYDFRTRYPPFCFGASGGGAGTFCAAAG